MRLVPTLIAALALAVAVPVSATSADYSYRTIAEGSNTTFLGDCPATNNFGAVAFAASDSTPRPPTART
jgi:hypothetical protein